jgi:hypothetical protein
MAKFSTSTVIAGTPQPASSSMLTTLTAVAASSNPRRGKLYDVMFGTLGTPADQTYAFQIERQTAVGTGGSTAGPEPLDPADTNLTSVCVANPTANGTLSTPVFYLGINQRASYRWVAAPGSELVWPATASNGFALQMASASGGTAVTTGAFLVDEQ